MNALIPGVVRVPGGKMPDKMWSQVEGNTSRVLGKTGPLVRLWVGGQEEEREGRRAIHTRELTMHEKKISGHYKPLSLSLLTEVKGDISKN